MSSLSIRKGTSQQRDPVEAARELHAAIFQPDLKLAVFYCAADFDLPALAKALHAQFGDVNLVGCTTAGTCVAGGVVTKTTPGHTAGAVAGALLARHQ